MNRKSNIFIMVLGVMVALLSALLPLSISFLTESLINLQLILIALLLGCILFVLIVRMLLDKRWIMKMAAIPVIFAVVMSGLIIYFSGFYHFIMAAAGITEHYDPADPEILFNTLMPIMQIGIWISTIPVWVAAIMTFKRVNKHAPKKLEEYLPALGRIISVERTDTYVNKRLVYKVKLEVRSSISDIYEVTRELAVSEESLSLLTPQTDVRVLVHEEKKSDLYFDLGNGVIL